MSLPGFTLFIFRLTSPGSLPEYALSKAFQEVEGGVATALRGERAYQPDRNQLEVQFFG